MVRQRQRPVHNGAVERVGGKRKAINPKWGGTNMVASSSRHRRRDTLSGHEWLILILFLIPAIVWLLVAYNYFGDLINRRGETSFLSSNNKGLSTTKKILYLNQYWDMPHFQFGIGRQPFVDAGCPVSNCEAVQYKESQRDSHYWGSFDAVLLHAATVGDWHRLQTETSAWRLPHQRFVYMTMESPFSYNLGTIYPNNFFNWTMTYRQDSDVPRPYGFFQPRSELATGQNRGNTHYYYPIQWTRQQEPFVDYDIDHFIQHVLPQKPQTFHQLAERPKKVAWIVSRCESPSRREDYVAELSKYIPVDIMGGCGSIPCNQSFHVTNRLAFGQQTLNQHDSMDNCSLAVATEYKFYLAFENSFCDDYVTEKFFRRLQGYEESTPLVIVMGGANYSRIAPPHSYVNALDYDSPQALADYLHALDQNRSLYLSYFWWKDYYQVHSGTATDHASSMCRLCEMLHTSDNDSKTTEEGAIKTYESISDWHGADSQCWGQLPNAIRDLPRKNKVIDDNGELVDDNIAMLNTRND